MKKIYFFALISIGIITIFGCADSNVPQNYSASLVGHTLSIENNNLKFEAQGGSINTTVNTNNVSWAFTNLPMWLEASPMSGASTVSVTFTASENHSADTARTSIFYLESKEKGWSYRTAISVSQKAVEAYITPGSNSLSFRGGKESQTISVLSNVKWQSSTSASWIKAEASPDMKTVTISVDANPSDVSRSATVTLSANNGISSTINITQAPADVTASTETLEFEKEGGSKSISITSEATWEVKTSDSWITFSPLSGDAGTHNLKVIALENNSVAQRNGNVYVNIGGSTKLHIPVVQKGIYLEVKPNSLSFSADAESQQINVNSNTDWEVLSMPDWLSSNTQTGKNSQTITISSNKNTTASKRNGKIKIGKEGLSLVADVDVVQEGLNLNLDNNNLQFSDKASSQKVTINTMGEWNVSTSNSWIHFSRTTGIGTSVLMVSVDENTNEDTRTGQINVAVGDLSQTIVVVQQGKYFNITETDKTFTSKGGSHQISFSTNESWTASLPENVSWLSLSSKSGTGDAVINLTAKDNASMKSRECVLTITPDIGQGAKIKVKQDGRYLSVNTQSLKFNSSGGTSEAVTISTDGTYDVTVTDSWMKIDEISRSSFRVGVSENEGKSRNGRVLITMTGLANGETYSLSVSVEQEGNDVNGHEYVDLGLSVCWSSYNIGASSNVGIGTYYNWSDASAKASDWGGGWRLPTKDEFQELVNKCTASSVTISGKQVLKLTGPSGKSIYLPLSGIDLGKRIEMVGDKGFYWSQTSETSGPYIYHYCLEVRPEYAHVYSLTNDSWLMNVRPVVKR